MPPGITGFAQLRLTREMTWAEKLAHDFEYIADRSLRLYFEIIAETAWLVLSRPFRPADLTCAASAASSAPTGGPSTATCSAR